MSTSAPPMLIEFADAWEALYPSAVFAGIVGDAAHQANGGYHISIEDQSSSNYSVTRPDDAAPPGGWPRNLASGVDMSVNTTDMFRIDSLVHAVWKDHEDSRRAFINAVNCWDGNDSPGRYDMYSNVLSGSDDSHKWHVHWEYRRRYVADQQAMAACLSILKGETKEQWQAGGGTPPPAKPQLRRPWPSYMPHNEYFGLISGPNHSHGGYYQAKSSAKKDERPDITAIQNRLNSLGYNCGTADGIFGDKTKAGVSSWQHALYPQYTSRYGEVWSDDWQRLFTY
jgi:hypothetical protein